MTQKKYFSLLGAVITLYSPFDMFATLIYDSVANSDTLFNYADSIGCWYSDILTTSHQFITAFITFPFLLFGLFALYYAIRKNLFLPPHIYAITYLATLITCICHYLSYSDGFISFFSNISQISTLCYYLFFLIAYFLGFFFPRNDRERNNNNLFHLFFASLLFLYFLITPRFYFLYIYRHINLSLFQTLTDTFLQFVPIIALFLVWLLFSVNYSSFGYLILIGGSSLLYCIHSILLCVRYKSFYPFLYYLFPFIIVSTYFIVLLIPAIKKHIKKKLKKVVTSPSDTPIYIKHLQQLFELKEHGVLTEDEFEAKKVALLQQVEQTNNI